MMSKHTDLRPAKPGVDLYRFIPKIFMSYESFSIEESDGNVEREFTPRFEYILAEEQISDAVDTILPRMKELLSGLEENNIPEYEERFQEESRQVTDDDWAILGDEKIDVGYLEFKNLRNGFSEEAITILLQHKNDEQELRSAIRNALQKEREQIGDVLNRQENQELLIAQTRELKDAYDSLGAMPSRADIPPTEFIGPTGEVFIRALEWGMLSTSSGRGQGAYLNHKDIIKVVLMDKDIEVLSAHTAHTYKHENTHAWAFNRVVRTETENTTTSRGEVDLGNVAELRGGFALMNSEGEFHIGIDEGTTELLTRYSDQLAGREQSHEFGFELYDSYVADMKVLSHILGQDISVKDIVIPDAENDDYTERSINLEGLKLLGQYRGLEDGIEKLRGQVEDKLGEHSFFLFDLVGAKFIARLQQHLRGEKREDEETIKIRTSALETENIDPNELRRLYPFIELTTTEQAFTLESCSDPFA
jgi:hypothetical protein